MRKFLTLWIALAAVVAALCGFQQDSRAAGFLLLVKPAPGANVNWTPTANPPIQPGTINPQQFSGVAIGTPAANRYVIVCGTETSNGPFTAVSVDVGGGPISATQASDGTGTSNTSSLWYANVPTGTTATVKLTSTAGFAAQVGLAVGTINTSTPLPNSIAVKLSGSFLIDPQNATSALTVLTNGIGIVCAGSATPNASPTWNAGAQDFKATSGTAWQLLLGHLSSSGTPSISGYSFADFSIAAASWGP